MDCSDCPVLTCNRPVEVLAGVSACLPDEQALQLPVISWPMQTKTEGLQEP